MKKTALLNSQLSYVISCLGHGDKIVIADAGLPIPSHVRRIDLAVISGVPSFFEVLGAVLCEMLVEKVIMAEELKNNQDMYEQVRARLNNQDMYEQGLPKLIRVAAPEFQEISHEEFKEITKSAICIVRTGEFTPYCNVILSAGVVF